MNIVLLNHYAGSPDMGMEFRPYYMAREWIKMGHSVRIVCGDFSHLRIKNPKISKDFEEDNIDGIQYIWLRTGDYKGNGVRRAATMFRFVGKLWLKAGWIAKAWKPDIVIASSTYPLDTYAAQKIAKKSGARLIHEVHDMWPATLYEIGGMSKHHPFVILMQIAENAAYKHSDKVVSLLPYTKQYMIRHGLEKNKFVYIPNGVSITDWEKNVPLPEKHKNFLKEIKEEKKFIVGYFGGHALSNSLDSLLDVAKQMKNHQDIVFVLVGSGVEKERLLQRKKNENIFNIYFLPPVGKHSIPELLTYFDCVYIGAKASPLYRFGTCINKMYDAMMGQIPIVCAITTPKMIFEEYSAGIKTTSENINGIKEIILKIKEMNPSEREKLGMNGKIAVIDHFSYEKLAVKFAGLF